MSFYISRDRFRYGTIDQYETSKIKYLPNAITPEKESEILQWLKSRNDFKGGQEETNFRVPRHQVWFDREKRYFGRGWKNRYPRWESSDYDTFLDKLEGDMQHFVPQKDPTQLNSCLINHYRNHEDSIRKHCDSPESFGPLPTILVLSIGTPRTIVFNKRHFNPENYRSIRLIENTEPISIRLESCSLLIMSGAAQRHFCHEVPREEIPCGERYSLTFREYLE